MISDLIKKLRKYPNLGLYRITYHTLLEKYENNLANFVIINNQIVGCCVIWNNLSNKNQNFSHVELGTIWVNREAISHQEKLSILAELGSRAKYMAGNQKLMFFCQHIKLAKYFRQSLFFPVNKIANHQNCPQNLLESIPQFRGWFPEDIEKDNKYTRLLYVEDRNIITPWYLIYE